MAFTQLDRPAQYLKGVGPKRSESLMRMRIVTARDLLYHVPRRYDDASTITPMNALRVGQDVNVVGKVRSKGVIPTRRGLRIFQVVLQDDHGMITVAWPGQPWLERKIREGDTLLVSGPIKFFHGQQIQPREFTTLSRASDAEEAGSAGTDGTIFVSYSASDEVPQWVFRTMFEKNLDQLLAWADDDEYLTDEERAALGLPLLSEALSAMHRPARLADAEVGRRRLAYDELFFLQLMQAHVRRRATQVEAGIAHARSNELIKPLHEALDFSLTAAQTTVLREIYHDMQSDHRMNRLLQGDVGSGKTIVALFAMLLAVEGGRQAALMAPTELLAEQHARRIAETLKPLGIEVVLLTGSLNAAARRAAGDAITSGRARIVIGTHALIQDSVDFQRLGLVVVDEQHRFGVRQRMALVEGATEVPDVLVMSATPIPRSMAMALYGDLDLSVLDELPPGRQPIKTALRFAKGRDAVYTFVEQELAAGRQAYVVYPLVSESEKVDLRAASEEYERLRTEVFPNRRLGLLHGQLKSSEKEATMRSFADGELDLIVATTVIEVGIDVANATVMVIENAERFGLSQLHQLRGRVGRGSGESHCILIAEPGEGGLERLKIFRDTTDGFEVARADLRIRGQGDLFGSEQSGHDPGLRFADLLLDEDLVVKAQGAARAVVEADPSLRAPANARLRATLESRYKDRLDLFGVG